MKVSAAPAVPPTAGAILFALVSERNVRSIIAGAVQQTIGVMTIGIGGSLSEARELERQFVELPETDDANTVTGGATELQEGF